MKFPLNLDNVCLDGIYSCKFSDNSFFTSRSVASLTEIERIPRESFPSFPPTASTLYALLGVLGAALVGGVVDVVALALSGGVGAGGGG